MMWPSLSSAAADLELLLKTCQHVANEMKKNSLSGRDISTLLATMYNAALTSVSQAQSFLISDRRPRQPPHSLLQLSSDTFFQPNHTNAPTEVDANELATLDASVWHFEPHARYDLSGGSWTTPV
jgi:hypothetical protein